MASLIAAEPSAANPPLKPSPRQPVPEGVEVIRNVEIGTGGGRVLHVEIARPEQPSKIPLPAVLWIHGGGWSGGSHVNNEAIWLATNGYFTGSVQYRLSAEAKWPAQIEDCKLAVRWLRANAVKYHVNPDRIGCWGASAGGHLVAFLGVTADNPQFEGTGGCPGVSSRIQAVVDFCGPADMRDGSLGIQGASGDADAPAPLGLAGAPFRTRPEVWKQMSPISHVSANAPPFLIVHGDNDKTVPLIHSQRLEAALKLAGVPVEFLLVKGGGHGLRANPGDPLAEPKYPEILSAVRSFFDQHLKQ